MVVVLCGWCRCVVGVGVWLVLCAWCCEIDKHGSVIVETVCGVMWCSVVKVGDDD